MTEQDKEQFLRYIIHHLLKHQIAYDAFYEWVKKQSGDAAGVEKVLKNCKLEVAKEPDLESRLQVFVEDALRSGEENLDLALASFLKQWTPKGRPN
jgi:hypothetical protein